MVDVKIGDVVTRASYDRDVFFKVVDICDKTHCATLKGINVRVLADAPMEDLIIPSNSAVREYKREYIKKTNESLERIFYRRELEKQRRLSRSNSQAKENNGFFDVPGRYFI